MSAIRLRTLRICTPDDRLHALDRILEAARDALVPRTAVLEKCRDRAWDAEHRPERVVVFAEKTALPLGLIDVEIGHPEPLAMTFRQIAVHRKARRRGIASQLIRAGVRRAHQRAPHLRWGYAYVLPCQGPAAGFWQSMGFEPDSPDCYSIELTNLSLHW